MRPYLDNGLFEFSEEALLLQRAETGVVRGAGGEGAEGGLGRGAGVDGGLGSDEVVRVQGNGGRGRGEKRADLGRNIVAAEGGVDDAFLEEEAVVDGSHGKGGGADVDYEGGGFPGGEAVGCKSWLSE